jgi:hypothetical protein
MKIGMTGSRNGITNEALQTLTTFIDINLTEIIEVHHGDCIGADKIFHDICFTKNFKIVIHPPKNNTMRAFCKSEFILPAKEYLERNRNIVDSSDILIAFPATETEELRSGTWATIRYARKQNKKIIIINTNGKIA